METAAWQGGRTTKGFIVNPIDHMLDRVYQVTGVQPTKNGKGWITRCPAHDDRRPSLSISEGDDGRVLLHCHAGCSNDDILSTINVSLAELFPSGSVPRRQRQQNRSRSGESGSSADSRRDGRRFQSADEAIKAMSRGRGRPSAEWSYRNATNATVGMVVRWDETDPDNPDDCRKIIRPLAQRDDGWAVAAMPEPRPLYGLPELNDAGRIFVVEGEKCVDALQSLGLTGTTWAGGSNAVHKTDWTPLAGCDVVIIPDNDDAGRTAANAISDMLLKLSPSVSVRILHMPVLWPDCPEKGDIADWAEQQDGPDADPLTQWLNEAAQRADALQVRRPVSGLGQYVPFPTHVLPAPIRDLVLAGAKAIGCDPAYIALPALSVFGMGVGNSRRLRLKVGWDVPAIVWTVTIGKSGCGKSPGWEVAMMPVRRIEKERRRCHREAMAQHRLQLTEWEQKQAARNQGNKSSPEPERPVEPQLVRLTIDDTTIEAVAQLLSDHPRGLLLAINELSSHFGGSDKYKSGKSDAPRWLSMFDGTSLQVDRKTGDCPSIYVSSASTGICGGTQPGVFRKALGEEHRENGTLPRFLAAYPPEHPKQWTDDGVDEATVEAAEQCLLRLCHLDFETDRNGEPVPEILTLSADAKTAWVDFYNQHAAERDGLGDDLASAWSKLEQYAARLALVIHLTRWAADEDVQPRQLDVISMRAGVTLSRWFAGEARRIYTLLDQSPEDDLRASLIEFIRRQGGEVAPRDLISGLRRIKNSDEAEAALSALVEAEIGTWVNRQRSSIGGRPGRVFRLFD